MAAKTWEWGYPYSIFGNGFVTTATTNVHMLSLHSSTAQTADGYELQLQVSFEHRYKDVLIVSTVKHGCTILTSNLCSELETFFTQCKLLSEDNSTVTVLLLLRNYCTWPIIAFLTHGRDCCNRRTTLATLCSRWSSSRPSWTLQGAVETAESSLCHLQLTAWLTGSQRTWVLSSSTADSNFIPIPNYIMWVCERVW